MFRPAASATIRNCSEPKASITRRVLQPIEPVEPKIEIPLTVMHLFELKGGTGIPPEPNHRQDADAISLRRRGRLFVRPHQIDRLAVALVRSAGDSPVAIAAIREVDRRVHDLLFADDLEMQRRLAVSIVNVDLPGDK